MHVAHLHLGQRGHLTHLVRFDVPCALLFELGEVELLGLQLSIMLCLFAWDNHLNLGAKTTNSALSDQSKVFFGGTKLVVGVVVALGALVLGHGNKRVDLTVLRSAQTAVM